VRLAYVYDDKKNVACAKLAARSRKLAISQAS